MSRRFVPIIASLVLSCSVGHISANDRDSSILIRSSLVTGEFTDEKAAGNIVGRERLASSPSLADAIRGFTGLQIKDYGGVGGLKTINVRSLGSEHTAVMIDGIAVENAQNMQIDLGRFAPESFSSALLRTGGSSMLLTAKEAGSGAVLSLKSAEPQFEGRKNNFKLRLRGGSFGTISPSLTWNSKISNKTSISTNAEMVSTNGRYRFHETKYITLPSGQIAGYDTTLIRRNGDLTSFRAQSYLRSKPSDRSIYEVTAYWYDSERGLPGPVVRRADYDITSKDRQTDRNLFIQGGSTFTCKSNILKIRGKYSYDYTRYKTSPEEDPQAMPYDNKYRQHSAYLSVADRWSKIGGLPFDMDGAADIQYNTLDANLRNFVYPKRLSFWANLILRHKGATADYSAGAQYALAADRFASDGEGFTKENNCRQAISPYADFRIRLLNHSRYSLSVKGFTRKTFRMPSFNDLYYTLVGNSNLSPEKAWQNDLGLISVWKPTGAIRMEGRLEGYFNKVSDKIIAVPTANQFRWTMYNIGDVRIQGLEAEASVRKEGTLSIGCTARYTLQNARDYTYPKRASYKGQIPYIPLHSGSAAIDAAYKGWEGSLSFIANSRRWSSSVNIDEYLIDPFVTMDMRISKEIGSLVLRLSLNNILNSQYEIVKGYPMPGTNLMFTLEYSI